MNTAQTLFNTIAVAFSLSTATSLLLHDTNLDKAMVKAITPVVSSTTPGSDPHTHSERTSLYQAVRDLHRGQHRTQPRVIMQGERKYVLAKPSARGHHAFDNYSLPVVS